MALRNIRIHGDEVLRKTCKEVTEITPKIKMLIEDMIDTMYDLPSEKDIEKVIIDENVVTDGAKPTLIRSKIA